MWLPVIKSRVKTVPEFPIRIYWSLIKTDLAPYVHADLEVMRRDSELMRPGKPFVFTNCMTGEGIKELVTLIRDMALFDRVSEKEVEEMKV